MPDENEKLAEQVKALKKDMEELRDKVEKNEPFIELEERVTDIEETNTTAFEVDSFTPDTSRSGDLMDTRKMPTSIEEELKVLPFDIEFGKPTADVTTDVATVTLQPCDQAGNSFASADTATVYIANDRQVQAVAARGWTTTTVLSLIRFSPWVDDTPDIEGVLIGEPVNDNTYAHTGDVILRASNGARPGFLRCDGTSYLRTAYPALFADIGTAWGSVDGTHFNVPRMQGRVPVGAFNGTGVVSGGVAGKTGETGDYAAPGETGGKAFHGRTENGHPPHLPHYHAINYTIDTLGVAYGGDAWVVKDVNYVEDPLSSATDDLMELRHGGESDGLNTWVAGSPLVDEAQAKNDTDNRQPWGTMAYWIKT